MSVTDVFRRHHGGHAYNPEDVAAATTAFESLKPVVDSVPVPSFTPAGDGADARTTQAWCPDFDPEPVSAARPFVPAPPVEGRPRLVDVPLGIFDGTAASFRLPSSLWCARCGADFTSEEAAGYDRMLLAMHGEAVAAGWGRDPDGSVCCPACLPARDLPVVSGGIPAEVELMIAVRVQSGAYEDLDAERGRFGRRERHRRNAGDVRRGMFARRAA